MKGSPVNVIQGPNRPVRNVRPRKAGVQIIPCPGHILRQATSSQVRRNGQGRLPPQGPRVKQPHPAGLHSPRPGRQPNQHKGLLPSLHAPKGASQATRRQAVSLRGQLLHLPGRPLRAEAQQHLQGAVPPGLQARRPEVHRRAEAPEPAQAAVPQAEAHPVAGTDNEFRDESS